MKGFRIGQGYDVHRFDKTPSKQGIVLAGIRIPHTHALLAHSDGDVVTHAFCDALLGALALGDIGRHFPDSDPRFLNIDSLQLLSNVYQMVTDRGWGLVNADMTVIAEAPRLAPFIAQMQDSLAGVLHVDKENISLKATTTEQLGFTGRGEGIAVNAIVLLTRTGL